MTGTPTPDPPDRRQSEYMAEIPTPDDPEGAALAAFNDAMEEWLNDAGVSGLLESVVQHRAGTALAATIRAIAEARTHDQCPRDDERVVDLVVSVTGTDGIATLQRIPPGVNYACVLLALQRDPQIAAIVVLGWAWHSDPLPDHEPTATVSGGVRVTAEPPDMVATFDGDLDADVSWSPDLATAPPPLAPYIVVAGIAAMNLAALAALVWRWLA